MAFSHLFHQGPVLGALGKVAFSAMKKPPKAVEGGLPSPGPWVTATVPPRSPKLVAAYLKAVGGSAKAWGPHLPPHLFPQWGFPLQAATLTRVPYPLAKVLNQGCRVEVHAPLPAHEPLQLRARLESVTEDETKARIHQVLETGTASVPKALTCHTYAVVPLRRKERDGPRRAPATVPPDARELRRLKLPVGAGWSFATLTGDVNPIHWIGPAARAAGFKNVILHGFATLAHACEAVIAERWGGDTGRLKMLDVRFVKPLVLPASMGVFLGGQPQEEGEALTVGPASGGLAVMTGAILG